MTWYGNQLTGISDTLNNLSVAYVYDSNGLRQKKTVNNVVTDYYYNGSVLIGLTKGTDTLRFSYDASGQVQAVDHNGTYCYYLRNGQGDIVKLIDGNGTTVVEYTYDSWGKPLSCTGTLATTLGALNPFRYRGYVYDEETGFYYLKSRYYDPETCRFISADVLLSTGQGVLGHNCYAYCRNNPVNRFDSLGISDEPIIIIIPPSPDSAIVIQPPYPDDCFVYLPKDLKRKTILNRAKESVHHLLHLNGLVQQQILLACRIRHLMKTAK